MTLTHVYEHFRQHRKFNIKNSKIDLNQYVPLRKTRGDFLEGSRPLKTLIWYSFYPFHFLLISTFSLFLYVWGLRRFYLFFCYVILLRGSDSISPIDHQGYLKNDPSVTLTNRCRASRVARQTLSHVLPSGGTCAVTCPPLRGNW